MKKAKGWAIDGVLTLAFIASIIALIASIIALISVLYTQNATAAEFDPTPGVGMTAWGQALPPRCNAYFDTDNLLAVTVRPGSCVVPWLANLAEFWRWGANQPAPHTN